MLDIRCFPLGELEANCYFVADDENGASFVVDPGISYPELEDAINAFGADKLLYILLTHGHFDHTGGVAALRRSFPAAKIVIGEPDGSFTENDMLNLSAFFGTRTEHFKADITVTDGQRLPFGSGSITVISTPGHTRGGVCYHIGNKLFTGDTIMRCTTGRMDFPTGSSREMYDSLQKIAELPDDTELYCGHGSRSDLSYEKKHNIFMGSTTYDDLY